MKNFKDICKAQSESSKLVDCLPPAVAEAISSISLNSDDPTNELIAIASAQLNNGNSEVAFELAEHLYSLETKPSASLCNLMAAAARQTNRFETALAVSEAAHEQFPDDWHIAAELIQAYFNCDSTQDLLPLCTQLTEREPDFVWGWQLRARAAERASDFNQASQCWEKAIDLHPEEGTYVFALLNSLILGGNTSKANEVYSNKKKLIGDSEKSVIVERQLALNGAYEDQLTWIQGGTSPWYERDRLTAHFNLHNGRYSYDSMIETARAIAERSPDQFQSYRFLLDALFKAGRYDQGWELCDYLESKFPAHAFGLAFLRCRLLDGWGRYGEAIEMLEAQVVKDEETNNIVNTLLLAQRYKRIGRAEEAYLLMKNAVESRPTDSVRLTLLARYQMGVGKDDLAIRTLQNVKRMVGAAKFGTEFATLASWLAYQLGNMPEAKRLMETHNSRDPYHTLFKSTPPVEIKAAETEIPQKNHIRMFTHVYNEITKLKAFLMHYRRLGVDVFYITDNGSTDGTHQFLMEQPDVRLFYSDTAFSDAGFGIWWINHLVQRYAAGSWCMHADVDELLVFPHSENLSLQQLTDYMDSKGQEVLLSYMLDLYPKKMSDVLDWDGSVHPAEVCPFFDDNIHFFPNWLPPYQEVWGGFRARIMGDGHGPGQLANKTPLFKGSKDFRLLLGTHYTTPAVPSDVTSACLHFKFIGDVQETYSKTLEHDEHHDSCFTYRQYLSWLDSVGMEDDLRAENTHRFRNSQTLLDLGLIKTSVEFEKFAERQEPTFQADLPKVFILTAPGSSASQVRQALRSFGLQGEVYSDFPVHTKSDLEERHLKNQIFTGLAPIHDYQYLYHLIPQSHFILLPQGAINWAKITEKYSLDTLGVKEFHNVLKLYDDKKQFHSLPHEKRGVAQCLARFLQGAYSWSDAAERFGTNVKDFFSDKEPGRFTTISALDEDAIVAALNELSFLKKSKKPTPDLSE